MASAGVLKPRPTSLYHLLALVTLTPARFDKIQLRNAAHRQLRECRLTSGLGVLEKVLLLIVTLDL